MYTDNTPILIVAQKKNEKKKLVNGEVACVYFYLFPIWMERQPEEKRKDIG